jgi:acyl-CoA thioesterase-1
MRSSLRWIAGLALGLACARGDGNGGRPASAAAAQGVAANGPAVPDSTRRQRSTLLFIGTSLTAGLGLEAAEAYPALIQLKVDSAGLPFDVVNAGVSGETSAGALRRLDWLMRGPADVVVIETGANDGLRGVDVDSVRANIQAILAAVRRAKPAARVLLVQMEAPPNFGQRYTTSFRRLYPELAAENGVTLLPFLLDSVAGHAELNQPDGIHPNVAGERIVADRLWRALRRQLEASLAGRSAGGGAH